MSVGQWVVALLSAGFMLVIAATPAAAQDQGLRLEIEVLDHGANSPWTDQDGKLDAGQETWLLPIQAKLTIPPASACLDEVEIWFHLRDVSPGLDLLIDPPTYVVDSDAVAPYSFASRTHTLGVIAKVQVDSVKWPSDVPPRAFTVDAVALAGTLQAGCTWAAGEASDTYSFELVSSSDADATIASADDQGAEAVPGPSIVMLFGWLAVTAFALHRRRTA